MKITAFLKDVKGEFNKISWVPQSELMISLVVVLSVTLSASLFFSLIDYLSMHVIRSIIKIGA